MITRLRLDARLFDPPARRRPGAIGRPRVIGRRQPTLAARLADPKTRWQRLKVTGWYGRGERLVDNALRVSCWVIRSSIAQPTTRKSLLCRPVSKACLSPLLAARQPTTTDTKLPRSKVLRRGSATKLRIDIFASPEMRRDRETTCRIEVCRNAQRRRAATPRHTDNKKGTSRARQN